MADRNLAKRVELQILQLRDEMRGEFFGGPAGDARACVTRCESEIRAGDEETRVRIRVLHEEV